VDRRTTQCAPAGGRRVVPKRTEPTQRDDAKRLPPPSAPLRVPWRRLHVTPPLYSACSAWRGRRRAPSRKLGPIPMPMQEARSNRMDNAVHTRRRGWSRPHASRADSERPRKLTTSPGRAQRSEHGFGEGRRRARGANAHSRARDENVSD
jgi:hypothetical protein